jgi:hypothetical protein
MPGGDGPFAASVFRHLEQVSEAVGLRRVFLCEEFQDRLGS